MVWRCGSTLLAACFFGGFLAAPVPLQADPGTDFRVENRVYRAGDKEPTSRSTTIFHQGVVYDYLDDPAEVIVFDRPAGRFVLLDLGRHVRCELTTDELQSFVEQISTAAAKNSDPFLRFLAAPDLTEQFDESSGELKLTSSWLSYRVTTLRTEVQSTVESYREFADWYARLNTMLNPGSHPPTARLALDAALARHQLVPREVRLMMTPKRGFPPRRVRLRSEHQLIRPLAAADLDRVAQTREFMQIFERIGFHDYRRPAS